MSERLCLAAASLVVSGAAADPTSATSRAGLVSVDVLDADFLQTVRLFQSRT